VYCNITGNELQWCGNYSGGGRGLGDGYLRERNEYVGTGVSRAKNGCRKTGKPLSALAQNARSMETDTHGTGEIRTSKTPAYESTWGRPSFHGEAFGDTVCVKRRGVVGEHGQGFLVLVSAVLGERNPCPYEIPPPETAAGHVRAGPE